MSSPTKTTRVRIRKPVTKPYRVVYYIRGRKRRKHFTDYYHANLFANETHGKVRVWNLIFGWRDYPGTSWQGFYERKYTR